jgi:hypothetical protein
VTRTQARDRLRRLLKDGQMVDTLAANITDTSQTITLTHGGFAGKSQIWEIGTELIRILAYDQPSKASSAVIRGFQGTTAAAATSGAIIRTNPRFSTLDYNEALDTAISRMNSLGLFQIKGIEFTYSASTIGSNLAADVREVYQVFAKAPGGRKEWKELRNFEVIQDANTTDFASGKALQLSRGYAGQTVRVTYKADYGLFTSDSDDTQTNLGIQAYAEDAIIYGAAAELYALEEADRVQIDSAEESSRGQLVPVRAAAVAAAQFNQKFETATREIQRALTARYRPTVRFK